jgi:SOS-response transcriptional repressor LexA
MRSTRQGERMRESIVDSIRWSVEERRIAPTLDELAEWHAFASRSGVKYHIDILVGRGVLRRYGHRFTLNGRDGAGEGGNNERH